MTNDAYHEALALARKINAQTERPACPLEFYVWVDGAACAATGPWLDLEDARRSAAVRGGRVLDALGRLWG
jgi:hypothetical protein